MLYYLVRFIIVALLLILQAYLSENLIFIYLCLWDVFIVSYEQLEKFHSNYSWINHVLTSNESTTNNYDFLPSIRELKVFQLSLTIYRL